MTERSSLWNALRDAVRLVVLGGAMVLVVAMWVALFYAVEKLP